MNTELIYVNFTDNDHTIVCDYANCEEDLLDIVERNKEKYGRNVTYTCDEDSSPIAYFFYRHAELKQEYWSCFQVNLDNEIILAGLQCEVKIEYLEEAYMGRYDREGDFAEEYAKKIGEMPTAWPTSAVDWQRAGYELLQDFSMQDYYCFRNM